MLLGVAVMKVMGLKPLLETPLKGDYVRATSRATSAATASSWSARSATR